MGWILEVALPLVETRKLDENVRFETCFKRIGVTEKDFSIPVEYPSVP